MKTSLFLKPAKGVRVFNPATEQMLSVEGENVEANRYWLRRIKDGSAVKSTPITKNKKKVSK